MASCTSIKCCLRNLWVAATPEEKVRQHLLQKMLQELGFPKGLIAVEKELEPALQRRFDILCYWKQGESLRPLLVVECKAESSHKAAQKQVFGYNHHLQAPFLCIASPEETQTLWKVQQEIQSVPFLPSYPQLVEKACRFFPS